MKLNIAACWLLPTIIAAEVIVSLPQITQPPTPSRTTESEQVPSISTVPTTFMPPTPPHAWDPIVSGASKVLEEIEEHLHIDLRKRQGGAAITAAPAAAATTVPTQMPAITTYDLRDGKPLRVYTQIFPAVPDQWPSPSAGTIGLGTIQGQIGVVKTISKRNAWPEPTASPGQVVRIKGREVFMS